MTKSRRIGSVVTRDIPPMCFAAGVPCKVIREITDEDLKEFEPIPAQEDDDIYYDHGKLISENIVK